MDELESTSKLEAAAKLNLFKYVFDERINETQMTELRWLGVGSFVDGANWMKEQLTQSEVTKTSEQVWTEEDEEEHGIAIEYLQRAGQWDSANWLRSLKERLKGE